MGRGADSPGVRRLDWVRAAWAVEDASPYGGGRVRCGFAGVRCLDWIRAAWALREAPLHPVFKIAYAPIIERFSSPARAGRRGRRPLRWGGGCGAIKNASRGIPDSLCCCFTLFAVCTTRSRRCRGLLPAGRSRGSGSDRRRCGRCGSCSSWWWSLWSTRRRGSSDPP